MNLISQKTDPVVKLVLRYIIGLRKGKPHVTKMIQAWRNNPQASSSRSRIIQRV